MAKEGRRDDDKLSRKRKNSEDLEDAKVQNDETEGGKRREKHKHKHHHRKHKHRRHKHGEEGSSAKEDETPVSDLSHLSIHGPILDETEDGEILEEVPIEDGQMDIPKDDGGKNRSNSGDRRSQENRKPRSRSPDVNKSRGASPDRKRRSRSRDDHRLSPDRKRRSRSRDDYRLRDDYHHSSRMPSPDRRSYRSRSRDIGGTRKVVDERRRERDVRSREYTKPDNYTDRREYTDRDRSRDERDRYSRRSSERVYRDERVSRDDRYRERTNRREREDKPKEGTTTTTSKDEDQEEYLERVAHQLAEQEEDEEKLKEERRRRRQAIMEKYKSHQDTKESSLPAQLEEQIQQASSLTPQKDVAEEKITAEKTSTIDDGEGIITPSTLSLQKPPTENNVDDSNRNPTGLGEGSPKDENERSVERSADMFCDIFGESPPKAAKVAKPNGMHIDTSGLTDNWDDAEGYYTYRIGEVLDNRYEIASSHGKGVFSTVVRARDTKAVLGEPVEVAIKIIRNNETMYKAGQRELVILRKLAGADPENRRHCVRLLSSFEYRNHLCLVFESLHMNLREILKKFGRNIGISLKAVRAYAQQLFTALKHLRNCGVLHCDIKPDNMLVNEPKNVLKLCDFGSAMFAGENEITPYLVSRFYRAPEIILGLPYDHALDMWSVGCCLYELYTGKCLFPGPTNNDMLRLHMELKGPFPKKMLKKAGFVAQHFDQDYNFFAVEEDPVSKKAIKRMINTVKPKEISALIPGNADEDPKLLGHFKNLLERMFILDPEKRLTVSQALNHPFIVGGK